MQMQTFSVSLEVAASTMTLAELSTLLGRQAGPSSKEKGTVRRGAELWEKSVWKLESELDEALPLSQHIDWIRQHCALERLRSAAALPGVEVYLNIGVFYRGAYASVRLGDDELRTLSAHRIALEVACYPCS